MTKLLRKTDKLPPLGAQDGQGDDAVVRAKLFTPTSSFTWYVLEWDGEDEAFAFVTSHLCPYGEYGYVRLSELESLKTRFGPAVERDRHWPKRTMGEIRRSVDDGARTYTGEAR